MSPRSMDDGDPFVSPGPPLPEKKRAPTPLKHPRYEQPTHGRGFSYDKHGNLGYIPPDKK